MSYYYRLLLFLLLISINISKFKAADSISSNTSISGGQKLISNGGNFELGFFYLRNNSKYYLGIWYNPVRITPLTSVWIANRETSISDPNLCEFKISEDGNLVLLNESKSVIWSSKLTSLRSTNTVAVLDDFGNLILRDASNSSLILWQSSDTPCNTLLPGSKLAFNKITKQSQRLTSWKNDDDPSPGMYTLELDPDGNPQFYIIRNSTQKYWSGGSWNGQIFSDIPEMMQSNIFSFQYVDNDKERYFTYAAKDQTIITSFVLDISGQIKQLTWLPRTAQWILVWSRPKTQCDIYGICGAFGRCDDRNLTYCSCLKGFRPASLMNLSSSDYSSGCVRNTSLRCNSSRSVKVDNDSFYEMDDVKLPNNPKTSSGWTLDECKAACLNNCSCTAYAYRQGCLMWFGDLTNIQQPFGGSGSTLYLRLAASELRISTTTSTKGLAIGIVAVALVACLSVVCLLIRRKGSLVIYKYRSLWRKAMNVPITMTDSIQKLQLFDIDTISDATGFFADYNKLGEGGFGPVYKGTLRDGQDIAVKRLSKDSSQGLHEFQNEVRLIAELQHRNLVRLLGCCTHGERIVIYEFMHNGSLDKFLFDKSKSDILSWERRFTIIMGIARGLLYLHQDSILKIIHRDLKASNVLLDINMNPKISDFGTARIFGVDQTDECTRRVVGTYGYMAPEYVMGGIFSAKSDVFSFGVLMLEIVSGQKNKGVYESEYHLNLLSYAWSLWDEGKCSSFLDESISNNYETSEVMRSIQVGLLCVQERAKDRPTISEVITMLNGEKTSLPKPTLPGFSSYQAHDNVNSASLASANGMTMTKFNGR